MTKSNDMLQLIEELHGQAGLALERLRFNIYDQEETTLLSLYATMYELADTAIVLIKSHKHAGLHLIVRSVLEGFVDFVNLAGESDYLKTMQASYAKQYIKLLEDGVKGKNPFNIGFANNPQAVQALEDFRKQLDELRQSGFVPIQIKDKFLKADMEDEFLSLYNSLCSHSHNNIRSLQERHLEVDAEDKSPRLVVFKEPRELSTLVILDNLTDLLRKATAILFKRFEQPEPAFLANYNDRLHNLREAHKLVPN